MIAANPGPALHMALLGAVVVLALIVYAVVRVRRRREEAHAAELDRLHAGGHPSETSSGNER